MVERTPLERRTLIFARPQEAERFREEVGEAMRTKQQEGVDTRREVVAQAVAQQFERQGEGVDLIRHPWEHTPVEHEEAQQLVDLSFAKDLGTAIAMAKKSPHYPRNLDLFHDVLTDELYDSLKDHGLQHYSWAIIGLVIGILVAVLLLGLGIIVLLAS